MEKLSALGELASGVAHDFNNTLSGILGRAQLLQRTDDPEKLKRGLDIIIKTAEDGAKTVKRIQDFARQRRDHDFELVSIDQIPAGRKRDHAPALEELRRGIKHSHHAQSANRLEWDGDGRHSELREVLVNMVFNAIDAMPEGGTLSLTTRTEGDVRCDPVVDTGVGMYPKCAHASSIHSYYKGKAGLGLGLAVSFGIIRRHGGNIEVDHMVKEPSFGITLPLAKIGRRVSSLLRQRQSLRLKLCLRSCSLMKNLAPNYSC